MVVGIVGGILLPDRRSQGFSIRWGQVLEGTVIESMMYVRGPCFLAHLYRYIHEVFYRGFTTKATRCIASYIGLGAYFSDSVSDT